VGPSLLDADIPALDESRSSPNPPENESALKR
jgi:hypothetical protein